MDKEEVERIRYRFSEVYKSACSKSKQFYNNSHEKELQNAKLLKTKRGASGTKIEHSINATLKAAVSVCTLSSQWLLIIH